ncbi:hypothetical protein BHE74_00022729 [Ensete ventricosum]|nr:hypothetical protein BHE74_00022729 [Ensete ventricosum]
MLLTTQADVGSVEHRGSRIKRRSHTEAAASSSDRTRRQPHAAEAAQAAAPHASGRTGHSCERPRKQQPRHSLALAAAQAAAARRWRRQQREEKLGFSLNEKNYSFSTEV